MERKKHKEEKACPALSDQVQVVVCIHSDVSVGEGHDVPLFFFLMKLLTTHSGLSSLSHSSDLFFDSTVWIVAAALRCTYCKRSAALLQVSVQVGTF